MPEANTKCFQKVSHVIFDNDGTLMDSERVYTTAIQNLLNRFGHTFTNEHKTRCMGRPTQFTVDLVIETFDLPVERKELLVQFEAESSRLLTNVPLLPGVDDLLRHLYDQHVPMAIATSSHRDSFRIKARPHCELMSVFHHIVCGTDRELKKGKPAPDIFLLAASRFQPQPPPHCCLVFEDSPAGLQAGLAAGMQVVMIPDPLLPVEATKGATLVLRSMAEFQPELFGLPYIDYSPKFSFG
ncbi:hypothetical protein ACLKA7_002937 [Drosophila subpalustris]